jgi:hypothetical protein
MIDDDIMRAGPVVDVIDSHNDTGPNCQHRSPAARGEIDPEVKPLPGAIDTESFPVSEGRVSIRLDEQPVARAWRAVERQLEGRFGLGRLPVE